MTARVDFFCTDHEESSEKVRYWNRISSKIVGSAQVRPLRRNLHGRIERRNFGMIHVVNIDSSPVAVESLGDKRFTGIFILRSKRGICRLEQNDHAYPFTDQHLSIVRADEPYRIHSNSNHNVQIMYIPNKQLASRLADYMGEPQPFSSCQLTASFLDKLATADISRIAPGNLLHTTLDLIEIDWPRKTEAPGRSNAITRLEALSEYIDFHLSDPSLSAGHIAESLQITPRYIQKLFAERGTTLSKTICERRLLLAREYLTDTSRNITDVAIMCGFSDLSYFCRSFKKRFQVTARDCRKSVRTNGH